MSGSSWILNRKLSARPRMRLFCLPYAGGSAAIFRGWPARFPNTIEVCPVQLPGRGGRFSEASYTRLQPLLQVAAVALLPYLDRPFSFFGHSMGALIAFELSRLLGRTYGLEPAYIFVSGRRAPQIPCTERATHNLPTPAFIEELRRINGTPREVLDNPELMQLMLPIIRADFEVCETYEFNSESALDCPIAALGGLQDKDVRIDQLEAWRYQTTGPFLLHLFKGDHFYLHTSQSLLISEIIRELLECITSNSPGSVAPLRSPHRSIELAPAAEA
jgi:medium-chain acyl-[acyl-carrier-protein] hydrolase